ncbi:hypothetical protein AVEN_159012-1 [Araneus ventricosus]|uniref:Uncharacterized protein n=1 Tax=Araneus ventricosus TaxID=182803 RepID=A0A4Y2B9M7_ARAVE|nr:hypothetical protein AVEN_159012-1 [Araneus ventricosus]
MGSGVEKATLRDIPRRHKLSYEIKIVEIGRVVEAGELSEGNQSIGQYLSVHKDSFSNTPTNRRFEEAIVVDRPKLMEFKVS